MKNKILIAITILSAIIGCKDDDKEPVVADHSVANKMVFKMTSMFNTDTLVLRDSTYILPSGEPLEVVRFSFLMSHFYLVDEDLDTLFIKDHYALIDPKRGKDTFSLRNIPEGNYKTIGFEIGLENDVNFGNPNDWPSDHVMNPLNNGLYWDWNGGYIFMAIEGFTEVEGKNQAVVYHIAGDLLRKKLSFDFGEVVDHQALKTDVLCAVDFNALFDEPNLFRLKEKGYFSHSGDSTLYGLVQNYEHIFTF